ncbi:MAG: NnrS family protein [Methylotenera sp.]|uniref:NnrS family protein n=1 Tax=Methylotenera sp. TaxID=2051956 RepID=UPI0027206AF7|nr:NnrS family protein [Methylotenera sp.]MDO9392981.1 NnrS family protein [Methylotenera sp.]MDP1523257.1 NnrS family protein [Methylotenera sp.]
MQIKMNKPNQNDMKKLALFNLGFRPFFLGASIFAVISIVSWMLIYFSLSNVRIENVSTSQWHAHEMLYGYGMAVVAGFLLTAVKNWTGISTLHGKPLMLLFMLWCTARVLFLFGTALLPWAATADLLFGLILIVAIAIPIIKAKQWMQLAVVSKIILLWVGNLVFYLGCFGVLASGMLYAINGAVLLFISLILMIGRRVIPFFIERGVEYKIQLKQYKWLDISILLVFVALFLNVIFLQIASLTSLLAGVLFALNGYRLYNWYTAGIWRVPLLWSLYLSAWLINLGFFCYGLQTLFSHLSILTLHIFTIGGIGLMTLSMMSRVALGHTGRDIRKPSRWMSYAFAGVVASVIFRAVVPMVTMQFYTSWVLVAAIFWIFAFAIFVVIYTPILLKPRADGAFG